MGRTASALWVVCVLASCGGRSTLIDLPGEFDEGAGDQTTQPASSGAGASTSSPAVTVSAGVTTGSTGSIEVTGTEPSSAGVSTVLSATAASSNASTTPVSSTITCGTATCDVATQECCLDAKTETCVATGQCMGAALSCTGPSNCTGGDVCCAKLMGGSAAATCEATCGNGGGLGGGFTLCNTNADCPNMETCEMTPFGVKACERQRGGGMGAGGGGMGAGGGGGMQG